ncbi:aspartate/glutamate racemase family protein [Patulibacter defluvii]|uniref:aspartate/glutamate racemase family protein n=1 Tax=Patulibacter defluvii TaxID=3095358 RepID=UPI002A75F816|nr:aspartate/glutamate racemase family protein [Patulibacter sp. DM4]
MSEGPRIRRRIGVVNPNSSPRATALIDGYLRPRALADSALTVVGAERGPAGIDGPLDGAIAAVEAARTIAELAPRIDAFVLACGNDPGLDACRQVSDRPVVGIAEAGMQAAALVAASFSIVVLSPAKATAMRRLAHGYGHGERLASIVAMATDARALFAAPTSGLERLTTACAHARDHDGAEAIVLPGAAMAGNERPLAEALGMPVVCGLAAALRSAEMLVDLGLTTSPVHSYARRTAPLDLDGATGSVPTPGVLT